MGGRSIVDDADGRATLIDSITAESALFEVAVCDIVGGSSDASLGR
jgi:hypothetical protein